jgi:hypothetical protein
MLLVCDKWTCVWSADDRDYTCTHTHTHSLTNTHTLTALGAELQGVGDIALEPVGHGVVPHRRVEPEGLLGELVRQERGVRSGGCVRWMDGYDKRKLCFCTYARTYACMHKRSIEAMCSIGGVCGASGPHPPACTR